MQNAIGIPAATITLMMNIYTIIFNAVMGSYGDLAVAAMGVAMKVAIIGSAVSNGIGQACYRQKPDIGAFQSWI